MFFFKSSAEEISLKNKSFLKDLLKEFKLKSVYTTEGENNIEKAYDDLVLNDKKTKVKLKNQKDNFSETPEQKDFIEYIEDE